MAIKLADTLAPMGDFPAAEAEDLEITLSGGTKKSIQKAYEDGDFGGGGNGVQTTDIMPLFGAKVGQVYLYVGETTWEYTKGHNYRLNGIAEPWYCWTVDLSQMGGEGKYYIYTQSANPSSTNDFWLDTYGDHIMHPVTDPSKLTANLTTVAPWVFVANEGDRIEWSYSGTTFYSTYESQYDILGIWVDITPLAEAEQIYDPSSEKAQSGKAVAQAVAAANPFQMKFPNGVSWQRTNITSGYYSVFGNADDGTLVAAGLDEGLKYSLDNGKTWQDSNITTGRYSAFGNADDGTLVAATIPFTNKGIIYSVDNGKTWQDTNITTEGYSAFEKADDGTLVAANDSDAGLKYSLDSGKTWQDSNITTGRYRAFEKANDGTLVVGGLSVGIKYSVDNGKTWQDSDVTTGSYMDFGKANDGALLTCKQGYGIKYSVDNGKTWHDSNTTSGNYKFVSADDGTVVAGCNGGSLGIIYSVDNGRTWQNSNVMTGNYSAFVKADDGTLVVGANDIAGIKYSLDNGKTWQDSDVTTGSYTAFGKANDGTLVGTDTGIKYSPTIGFKDWIRKVAG